MADRLQYVKNSRKRDISTEPMVADNYSIDPHADHKKR